VENLRKYGEPPFHIAVLHGGPGGPGYMAPVARELSAEWGVLEPLQTADSLEGQVQELQTVLANSANLPVILVGSSWGAVLGFIVSARYPELVQKLLMIGSAAFDDQYATKIQEIRFSRLDAEERVEARSLMKLLGDPACRQKDAPFARLAALFAKADAYDPVTLDIEILDYQYHVYQKVWHDASELRHSGKLLELGKKIECPAVAIHGDYDPHPAESIEKPLAAILRDFRFILLDRCGHLPWIERQAKDEFYAILREELRRPIRRLPQQR
jgi:pimeloyl-ACP methyl ester carboxylesterase